MNSAGLHVHLRRCVAGWGRIAALQRLIIAGRAHDKKCLVLWAARPAAESEKAIRAAAAGGPLCWALQRRRSYSNVSKTATIKHAPDRQNKWLGLLCTHQRHGSAQHQVPILDPLILLRMLLVQGKKHLSVVICGHVDSGEAAGDAGGSCLVGWDLIYACCISRIEEEAISYLGLLG